MHSDAPEVVLAPARASVGIVPKAISDAADHLFEHTPIDEQEPGPDVTKAMQSSSIRLRPFLVRVSVADPLEPTILLLRIKPAYDRFAMPAHSRDPPCGENHIRVYGQ